MKLTAEQLSDLADIIDDDLPKLARTLRQRASMRKDAERDQREAAEAERRRHEEELARIAAGY